MNRVATTLAALIACLLAVSVMASPVDGTESKKAASKSPGTTKSVADNTGGKTEEICDTITFAQKTGTPYLYFVAPELDQMSDDQLYDTFEKKCDAYLAQHAPAYLPDKSGNYPDKKANKLSLFGIFRMPEISTKSQQIVYGADCSIADVTSDFYTAVNYAQFKKAISNPQPQFNSDWIKSLGYSAAPQDFNTKYCPPRKDDDEVPVHQ